ncbi:hypothetical protein GCM10020255_029560 [Rhodococcus baikonurensis]
MSVALNFQQTGIPDAPAVVLLGSLGSDLSMWQPQIHALSNRYRVIAVDHRGHGKSPVPAAPTPLPISAAMSSLSSIRSNSSPYIWSGSPSAALSASGSPRTTPLASRP